MRIMITGGGTGGHTSPLLAIVEELRRRDPQLELRWVGRGGGLEERLAEQHDIPFRGLPVAGWPRGRTLKKVVAAARLGAATLGAALLLRQFRPQAVVGVGGYVALPLGLAAQRMGYPTILHEQNKRLGLTNRLLAPRAAQLCLSYPETLGNYPKDRALLTGNPVRARFANPPARAEACAAFGLDPARPVVLVVGGSQGARALNTAVRAALDEGRLAGVQLLWMTGRGEYAQNSAQPLPDDVPGQILPFIEDMPAACAAADVVVSRAGASSTAELALLGKAAILVPYPHATDNHQDDNARAFEVAGAALVRRDGELTGAVLAADLHALLADTARREAMGRAARTLAQPLAAEAIVEAILRQVFRDA